jgi:hypothetical protein
MPAAVAPPQRGLNVFTNTFRSRNRAVSEVSQPPPRRPEPAQLPKAASYTYFPRVKDLSPESSVVALTGTICEQDFQTGKNGEATSGSSGGSSPSSEDAPDIEAVHMPELRPKPHSRRSSRFLPFSSKSREPSVERKSERKPDRGRSDSIRRTESPGGSPVRSLTKLRRKSWIVSQHTQTSSASPTRGRLSEKKEENTKKSHVTAEANKRNTSTSTVSILEESEARDTASDLHSHIPLNKKNKRLSGLFNATANAPPVPAIPKSFSTERLPLNTHLPTPLSPTSVPPLPRNISAEKLKGAKTEPRKKDELWTVFRTLDGDLRKSVTLVPNFSM